MRKIGVIASIVMAFILFIPNAKAIDEMSIIIDSDNNIEIYDKNHNEVTGNTTYTSAFSFSDGTLTLKEGYYFNYIFIDQAANVTSNNKKVHLNMLYVEGNSNINNLVSESYDTEDTFEWDHEYVTPTQRVQLYTHFHAKGEFNITNSNIKLTKSTDGVPIQNTIHSYENFDLKIKNSTIENDGIIYTTTTHNIVIEDSNVKTFILVTQPQTNTDNSTITINNSNIIFKKYTIPDEFLTNEYQAMLNLSLYTNNLVINNSYIENGNINALNNITITDSTSKGLTSNAGDNNEVNNSDLKVKGLGGTNLTITNSNITNKNGYQAAFEGETIKLIDSELETIGHILTENLDLKNSFLKVTSDEYTYEGRTFNYYSPMIVKNMKIRNSDFVAISNTGVPALIVAGELDIDKDNFVLVDRNNNILEYKYVTLDDYGFNYDPSNGTYVTNATILSPQGLDIPNGYTGLYDNKAAMYVATSELIEYTIKIKNGTWEDGTTGNKTITLLKGDVPTEDTFKSLGLDGYDVLKIEKTGDKEFTYVYSKLVNPKTGVRSLIILFFIAIAGIAVVLKENKNSSYFKFN